MRAFRTLALTQLKLWLREPSAFFFTLIFPMLLLLLFGAIWGNDPDPLFGGGAFGVVDAMVPAYAGMIVATVGLTGIPVATATAREQKILRRYRATPLPPVTYLAADVAVSLIVAGAGMGLLIVVGNIVYGLRFGGAWPEVVAGFLLSALAFFAGGYLLAALAPTPRAAEAIGQAIFFPLLFLSGATIPLAEMPERVRRVSELLPLTQVVQVMQGAWFGEPWSHHAADVAFLAAMLVVGVGGAAHFFRWG